MMTNGRRSAAFYDVDGTLIDANIVHVYLYYALRLPKMRQRAGRLLRLLMFSPAYAAAELMSRALFNRMFYAGYKGMRRERLRVMGNEIAERALLPKLYNDARKRIRKAKEMGLVQVIVSGSLEEALDPFAEKLGVDHVIANRLEFEGDQASGRLLPPLLTGDAKRNAMQAFAREHNIDLSTSYAFADSYSDLPMLETVGFPCPVNPDEKLRRHAEREQWPILHFA